MRKEAIKKTAVLRCIGGEDGYIVESPLSNKIAGVGDTPEEAWQLFNEILEQSYQLYKQGKFQLNTHPGRPKQGKTRLYADVKPEVKEDIAAIAKEIGISSGEVVEYLYMLYQSQRPQGSRA